MASIQIVSPFIHSLPHDSPQSRSRPSTSQSSSTTTSTSRNSHYRPFSTLYTESPYIEIQGKLPYRLKRHSSSFSGLQNLAHMGIGFKDKSKAKKNLSPVLQLADPTQVTAPRPPPPSYNALQRPSTSSAITTTPTLHRVKKKRSMASLFTATDPSASSASGSVPPSPGPHSFPSPSQSVDVHITISASVSRRTRFLDQHSNPMDDHDSSERFLPKSIWAKRHNMKLHPYHHLVPYMQAYDPILLESDRYSDLLLQRLTHGLPSFHDYGKKPPATVLDLGCGPGHWVLHAASVWKTSQITGLDLVDVALPGFETTENAHFVLGNFIAFKLPFPDNSFEYIRMANLVLCIPYEKWDYVLTEVHRVLTVNGRLELIDDQIFFPYGTAPKLPSSDMLDAFDIADFDEDKETLQGSCSDNGSTLNSSGRSNSSCEENHFVESPTLRPIASYPQSLTPVESTGLPEAAFDIESRHISWHSQATASRELESIFEIMLKQKYKIFPRPSDFVLNRMAGVFGSGAAGKTRSYHIKLAPVNLADAGFRQGRAEGEETVNSKSNGMASHFDSFSMKKKAWMGTDREKALKIKKLKKANKADDTLTSKGDTSIGSGSGSSSERSSLENPISVSTFVPPSTNMKAAGRLGIDLTSFPKEMAPPPLPSSQPEAPILSAKAAGRLGISYSDLASATAASTHKQSGRSRPSCLQQSQGLLVWPSTYIPLAPAELEMHANKYVHTLLGCKPALAEFIAQFVDEDGARFVDDDEFHEVMWNYECFRRSRFNWPSEIPDPYDDELTAVQSTPIFAPPPLKSKSGSKSNKNSSESSYNGLHHKEELTHIRTIRVFEATKSDDRSLASLLFHRTPTS